MPKVVPEYKEAAKDKIIKAAFKIFTKKGYHTTTMEDIAKEVGVSKGALYQYYKNKKELLNEIVLSYHVMFREVLKASFEKQDASDIAEEGSRALLKKYRFHHEMLFEVIAIAGHDPEIKQSLKVEYEKDIKLLEEFLIKQREMSGFKIKIEPNTLAQLYVALYLGMAMKVIMGDDSVEIHRIWSNAIEAMMSPSKQQ
jgi:AcrR family transcriptional regulator